MGVIPTEKKQRFFPENTEQDVMEGEKKQDHMVLTQLTQKRGHGRSMAKCVLTNDLSNVWHQQIATLSECRTRASRLSGHFLHVERLELSREPMQEDWRANDIGHLALRRLGDVVAYFVFYHLYLALLVLDHIAFGVFSGVLDPVFVEPFDGVDVGEAKEGACGWLEVWVELLDDRCGGWVGKEDIHGLTNLRRVYWLRSGVKSEYNKCADNFFDVGHEVFECNEAKFGLQVGVFTQVSPRMAEDCVSQSPYQ